jgi:hypothetical protein
MPKSKLIGTCKACGCDILSAMDVKDHTIGQQARVPDNYKSGMYVGAV